MKFIQDTQILFVRNFKKTLREPLWLFIGIMQPALYILLYMPLLKNIGNTSALPLGKIAQIFVPGMLIIMGVSSLFAGFGFIPEIREGYITRLLVTPVNRFAILLAMVMDQLFTLLMQSVILIFIALLLGLRTSVIAVILSLILVIIVGATTSCISYIISISARHEDGLASTVNTLYLPIMLLSGIMLPISLAPQWLKNIAAFNPFYYAVEAARELFLGNFTSFTIVKGFLIMSVFAAVALWFAVRSLRKMAVM